MTPPTVESPIRARLGGPLKLAIPRGALWGETLDALDGIGRGHRRDARRLALARLRHERADPGDDAALRRPHLRRGRRGRPRDHRQGRAAGAARGPDRLRDPRPRLRRLPDGAGGPPGRREPRRVRAATGSDADRDQVPANRRAPLRGDRPPGRGDRGQGLGRAGAAGRPRRRHRRPGRDGADAEGERPRDPRGDRDLDARGWSSNRVSHKLRADEVDDLVERLRPEKG